MLINLNISYSIKTILIFIVPYFIFLALIGFKKKENYLKILSILGFIFLLNFIYSLSSNIYAQNTISEIDKFEPYVLNKKKREL